MKICKNVFGHRLECLGNFLDFYIVFSFLDKCCFPGASKDVFFQDFVSQSIATIFLIFIKTWTQPFAQLSVYLIKRESWNNFIYTPKSFTQIWFNADKRHISSQRQLFYRRRQYCLEMDRWWSVVDCKNRCMNKFFFHLRLFIKVDYIDIKVLSYV